jgi:hypothetical protein
MAAANTLQIGVPLDIALVGKATVQAGTWTNNWGYPIYVFMAYVWVGVSMGNKGDVSFQLANTTQAIVYLDSNDDHFQDRNGLPENEEWLPNMSPDYFEVNPSDMLTLTLIGNADAGTPLVCQTYARVYYRTTP